MVSLSLLVALLVWPSVGAAQALLGKTYTGDVRVKRTAHSYHAILIP